MKSSIAFVAVLYLVSLAAGAVEPPVLFVPQHNSIGYEPDGTPQVRPDDLIAATNILDLLPAELLPGRWGQAQNGLQISLRMDKKTYQTNEPILSTIVIRNVSDEVRLIDEVVDHEMFNHFDVRDGNNVRVPFSQRTLRYIASGSGFDSSSPRRVGLNRQVQFGYELGYLFAFPPSGKFTVKVRFEKAESNEAWFSIGQPEDRKEEPPPEEAQELIKQLKATHLTASNLVALLRVQPVPKTKPIPQLPQTNYTIPPEEQRIWEEWRRTNSAQAPSTARVARPVPIAATNEPSSTEAPTDGSSWPVIVILVLGAGISVALLRNRSRNQG